MTSADLANAQANILHATAMLAAEVGITGISMRVLAQRLGLSPGALYRYFPSKQDLLIAFWRDALDLLNDRFAEIDRIQADHLTALKSMLRAYGTFGLEDPARFRLLFLETPSEVEPGKLSEATTLASYNIVVSRMMQARDAGLVVCIDPSHLAHIVWAGVHGAVTLTITIDDIDFGSREKFISRMIETLIRGITA
ncbi:TetR/AcrR family transcriptional regulator [Rhizobium panacihumi]